MIDQAEAHSRASAWLREHTQQCPCVLVDQHTQEHPFGWVFFYDSIRHLESGSFRDAIAGNAPLIVNRFNGSIHVTGTARPTSFYVEQYVATLTPDT